MTADNRTNEPTEAQVEAAAKALRADEGFMAEVHSALEVSWSEYIARLVLVAAQGAAPQAESAPYRIVRVLHEHQRDASVTSRVKCVCGVTCDDRASHRLHQAELIAHLAPAPVLPSSGVDEDKLAEVIEQHVLGEPNGGTASWAWINCSCRHRIEIAGVTREHVVALGRKNQARAVAEWLKGQGGESRAV